MSQNIFKEPGGCVKTFLKNLANVSKHWLVRNCKRYHSDSIVDQRLSKDHVVKVWVDSDLRQRKGQQVTWSCQFHQPTCSRLGNLSSDLVTSEKMASTATGSTAEMMLVNVKTWLW